MATRLRTMATLGAGLLAAAALGTAFGEPAMGQGFDIRSLFSPRTTTGSVPAATAPAPVAQASPSSPSAPPEWSGESGASGHPLMTTDAIRAAAENFRACL